MSEVGVTDNFFSLGGDSIKGIQMASRLNQHGWKLEMKDLFQHPTIEELTQYVERAEGKQADQGPVEGEVILTPIQRWFFEKNFTNKHHWNQSVMLHAKKGFDPERVEKTLPTRSSGLMPQSIRIRARRFAFAFSSPYVQDWPLYVTAGQSLWHWTVSSNS
ncbi:phosphopantetheine-binding protein [Bacillus subtilis subsp. subtilis]